MLLIFGMVLIVYGAAQIFVGTVRIRDAHWRTRGWWANHRILGFLITGPPIMGPRAILENSTRPSFEKYSGIVQLIAGTIFVIFGVLGISQNFQ